MRSLIFILLAGYAVKCDDASYYVIEMPEEAQRDFAKPFRVYWNVPTMQCASKKIPFDHLFDKFGIIQNNGDNFRGEKVSILYDPGLFPALLKNETSGKFKFRNGGVPQEGDLEKHLLAFRAALDQSIPDEGFSGVGIIDFESWRPVFRQNFGVLIPYKDISYQIERKLHWFWTERAIQARARQRFEEAARAFMQTTLSVAKQMRPRALWGYYGFPYCFNMATNNMGQSCSDKVPQENDRIFWLWSESTALFPSIYSSKELTSSQLAAMVRGRVAEAARVKRRGTPVLPYFWYRYRDGGYLTQTDLNVVLETLYKSDASGFMIWGSSGDVNTLEKCKNLLKYTTEVLGPAIAKYTKPSSLRNTTDSQGNMENPVSSSIGLTTWRPVLKDHLDNSNSSKKPAFLDPEYHWEPPENYSQDIAHYVEQEFKKKPNYNANKDQTAMTDSKTSLLLEIILNIFKKDMEWKDSDMTESEASNTNNDGKTSQPLDTSISPITVKNYIYNIERSTLSNPNIVTKNPLDTLLNKGNSTESPKMASDIDQWSTLKSKYDLSSTTSSYGTQDYASITQKDSESSVKVSYENDAVMDLKETTTEEPTVNMNVKILDDDYLELPYLEETFSNQLDVKDRSEEMAKLSTIVIIESNSETSFSTESYGVTSTSHEFLNVPLNNKVEDNLSTMAFEDFESGNNNITADLIETISTSNRPSTKNDSTISINSEDKPLEILRDSQTDLENLYDDIESSTLNVQDDDTQIIKEFDIFDYIFNNESNETSTEGFLRESETTQRTSTSDINVDESLEKKIRNSTSNDSTENIESSTSNTRYTPVYTTSSDNVPDSIVEEFSIETSTTEDYSSTTNEDRQVVVFL